MSIFRYNRSPLDVTAHQGSINKRVRGHGPTFRGVNMQLLDELSIKAGNRGKLRQLGASLWMMSHGELSPSRSRWWWSSPRGRADTRWAHTGLDPSDRSAGSRWSEAWWESFQWTFSGVASAAAPPPPWWWSLWYQHTEGRSTWGQSHTEAVTRGDPVHGGH